LKRALVAGVLLACSSSSDPASSGDGGTTTPTGDVSFSKAVIPILAAKCATSACHGNLENNLGVHLKTDDPNAVYAELQKTSPTANGAKFIVAGDPKKSFFFAKIEGAQDEFSDACLVPGCGETMPPGTKLGGDQRSTIRAWIEQGAKNN
jgi:hypothetical protein